MRESGVDFRARYLGEISGRYRLCGVDDLDSVSWNSGGGFEACCDLGVESVLCVEYGGVGETTISRHWGPFACLLLAASGASLCSPVGVCMVSWAESEGDIDWKA